MKVLKIINEEIISIHEMSMPYLYILGCVIIVIYSEATLSGKSIVLSPLDMPIWVVQILYYVAVPIFLLSLLVNIINKGIVAIRSKHQISIKDKIKQVEVGG